MKENDSIQIMVNDAPERVPAGCSVEALIKYMNEADPHLIVELNGRFVYAQTYSTTLLKDRDRIEFINPDFGG